MEKPDHKVARLLRSASSAPGDAPTEPPFGFATRVVSLWRTTTNNESSELTRLVRRVAVTAVAVTVIATAFAYRQISENDEIGEPLSNDYAIADSTIQAEFLQ